MLYRYASRLDSVKLYTAVQSEQTANPHGERNAGVEAVSGVPLVLKALLMQGMAEQA